MAYWLLKSEPATYGFGDLVRDGATDWDGVRNNAARLHLRTMAVGDQAFIYHSGAERAVVGIAAIIGSPTPDGPDEAWTKVRVASVGPLPRPVTLAAIKAEPALGEMLLVGQSRLSVSPVRDEEWALIVAMGGG